MSLYHGTIQMDWAKNDPQAEKHVLTVRRWGIGIELGICSGRIHVFGVNPNVGRRHMMIGRKPSNLTEDAVREHVDRSHAAFLLHCGQSA